MKISSELRTIISDAYIFAREQHHEFVTPEHLLREGLNHRSVLSILITSGGNVTGIRDGLDEFLAKNVPILPEEEKKPRRRFAKKAEKAEKTDKKAKTETKSKKEEPEHNYEPEPIETLARHAVMNRTY